jgi:hypothetical protein
LTFLAQTQEHQSTINANIMSIWTDITSNGERKHSIWKELGAWCSITYAKEEGNEEDRLIIDLAFNHLYYNSRWFHDMCNTPKIGIFVRNGFHFTGNNTNPHITFQFRGYGNEVDSTYYHAYFDRNTKLIVNMTIINQITLF